MSLPVQQIVKYSYIQSGVQTLSTLLSFVLRMIQHPEVQAKAQDELDRVIGRTRLPEFDDRDRLPYVDALVKETMRWHPMLPLSK